MNLTALAIDRDRVTLSVLLVVIVAGVMSYFSLPRNMDPGFIIRAAQVVTYFPGASPERVELLVSDKIEKAIQEIPELDFVNSESRTGVSIVVVNIKERYTDMRPIWDNLRRKVEKAAGDLPEGIIGPIVNDEFGDVFGIIVGLTGEGFTYAELKDVADEVHDELLAAPEAAKVEIFGAQEERVFMVYDNARLAEAGISPAQLSQILESRNIIIPGGYVDVGRERIALEPSGNFESLDELRRTVVNLGDASRLAYLEDIVRIERGYVDPPSSETRMNGVPALALAVSMREGGNISDLGEQVNAVLARSLATYPIGIELEVATFLPAEVDAKIRDFIANLLQAVVVVAIVMLLFLGLRTGLIVSSLIPAAMIMSLLVMSVLGIGLDQMSIASLIIALGMLVDNGIVMAESIMVQRQSGKPAVAAAVDSARELRVPLLTSSLTTAAAFLPIYLAESSTGEYTAPLFKVVTITLLCSWLIALTVIPLLTVRFMRVQVSPADTGSSARHGAYFRRYRSILLSALRHRMLTIAGIAALLVLAVYGLRFVPTIFFPPSDRDYFKVELELPIGSSIKSMRDRVDTVEAFLAEKQVSDAAGAGVTKWVTFIGNGGPRFVLQHSPQPASPHYALILINVSDYRIIDALMAEMDRFALEALPDVQITMRKIENGAPIKRPVEVRISGREIGPLFEIVERFDQQLAAVPGAKNISDDWGARTKKLVVHIDQARALRAGLSSEDIAVSLQTGLSGLNLTDYRENDKIIPVTLRTDATRRQDIDKLETLAVYSQATGRSVPLKQVADIEVVWEPAVILRRDGLKTVTVGAELAPGYTASKAFSAITPWLEESARKWQGGYRYELGGEAETSQKANASIAEKLPIAVLIIVVLLVAQFNSFRRTFIVLLTIPLGVIGVVAGLLVTQSYFGFMTLLGIISLAGIVINNAIVLLERINIEINVNGLSPQDAVIEAAQRRLRPILLTTATTVLGLVPLYLGGGEMWEPMAVSIIFGLLFATVLTLCVVPVMYSLLFGVRFDSVAD